MRAVAGEDTDRMPKGRHTKEIMIIIIIKSGKIRWDNAIGRLKGTTINCRRSVRKTNKRDRHLSNNNKKQTSVGETRRTE